MTSKRVWLELIPLTSYFFKLCLFWGRSAFLVRQPSCTASKHFVFMNVLVVLINAAGELLTTVTFTPAPVQLLVFSRTLSPASAQVCVPEIHLGISA